MKPMLLSFLKDIENLPDTLETDILVLETEQDMEILFRVFRSLYSIVSFADFFELQALKKSLNLVLGLITGIRDQSYTHSAEDIDILIEFVNAFQKIISKLQQWMQEERAIEINDLQALDSGLLDSIIEYIEERLSRAETVGEQSTGNRACPVATPEDYEKIVWPPDMKSYFILEATDRIDKLEEHIIALEDSEEKHECFQIISRHLHSLKGNAGTLIAILPPDEIIRKTHPLKFFHDLVHASEDLIIRCRDGEKEIGRNDVDLLLSVLDQLKALFTGIELDNPLSSSEQMLLSELKSYVSDNNKCENESMSKQVETKTASPIIRAFLNTADQCLDAMEKTLAQDEDTFPGRFSKSYIRAVKTLHKAAAKIENDSIYSLTQELFDQLEDPTVAVSSVIKTLSDQLRMELEDLRHDAVADIVAKPVVHPEEPSTPALAAVGKTNQDTFVRIPQKQVDRIMNLVGELIVTKNSFRLLGQELIGDYGLPKMADKVTQNGNVVGRITDELQAEVMDIRMIPLKTVFARFPRLIRDLSKTTGKKLILGIDGGDTLLDKMIVEQLIDPLTHIIRNCADHGIEDPNERLAANKPAEGKLVISAKRKGQFVILKVSDDGRGMHRQKIANKAIRLGIIDSSRLEKPDDQEIYSLVFNSGFSTAEKVTEVSGRGVGLDIVKTTMDDIGGIISIDSTEGKGTCFILKIPLTLAVTKGLMVETGKSKFILPLENIEEIIKIPKRRIRRFNCHQAMIEHRNRVLPVIDLGSALGLNGFANSEQLGPEISDGLDSDEISCIAIVSESNRRFALEVNKILNEVEILYKSLGSEFSQVPGISGATILGDGKIVLIVNPSTLMVTR